MIVYGSKAVRLNSGMSKDSSCPNCGTQGSLKLSVFRKHAHIFWIPMFPIGKKGEAECQNCQSTFDSDAMPDEVKRDYNHLKDQSSSGPIWQFAGLGLIAVLMVFGTFNSNRIQKAELEYIAAPKVGDVYEYEIESGSYSTMKVIEVSADSVFVKPNEYEINKRTKMYKIDKPENYAEFSFSMSLEQLKEMHTSGDIFGIDRD